MANYEQRILAAATAAVAKGHGDPENLRELLIWTTSKPTASMVYAYFRLHLDDERLLESLLCVAEEGDDSGDAPWAAANVIAEFPAYLLEVHKLRLEILSKHAWSYLSAPAKLALRKIEPGR